MSDKNEGKPRGALAATQPAVAMVAHRYEGDTRVPWPVSGHSRDLGLHPHEAAGAIETSKEPGADAVGPTDCGLIAYFERGKGKVFNAGTCAWVWGLELEDPFTMQITRNVLDRFGRQRRVPV